MLVQLRKVRFLDEELLYTFEVNKRRTRNNCRLLFSKYNYKRTKYFEYMSMITYFTVSIKYKISVELLNNQTKRLFIFVIFSSTELTRY